MDTLFFEGAIQDFEREDGGQAWIAEISDGSEGEYGMFVRIQSWDQPEGHLRARTLIGKRVLVTVEVVEDEGEDPFSKEYKGSTASTPTSRCIAALRRRAIKHADEYLNDIADEMQRVFELMFSARSALLTLEGWGCENFTLPVGACYDQGRTEDAEYLAERCCAACVAHRALMNP